MKIPWNSALRNKIESSGLYVPLIRLLTQNIIFAKYSHHIARKRVEELEKNRSYGLALENSSFCNAKCIFCPNITMERKKGFMKMEVFDKLVERLKQEDIKVRYVNMTGTGEPLMDKNVFKKIEILKREFPQADIFMPTNFALATKEIIEKIIDSGLDRITISLNADNPKDYKKLMGLSFERTVENIENLIRIRNQKKSNLVILITIVVNDVNSKSVAEFRDRWRDRVDSVVVNGVHSWAGAVERYNSKSGFRYRFACRNLFEQIEIHNNGDVALCCVDYEGRHLGGNVMKDKILDAIGGGDIGKIKKMHLRGESGKVEMCRQCRFSERGMDWLVR